MQDLTLDHARTIVDAALAKGREKSFKPLAVAVLDARGVLKAFAAQDGTSLKRAEIAMGKAGGALALGIGAVGISGDLSDNDEICALAGIEAAGLVADPGQD